MAGPASTSATDAFENDASVSTVLSVSDTSSDSVGDTLVSQENDVLIPSAADVDRVFNEGLHTWEHFLALAKSLPRNATAPGLHDPSIALKDVPALPDAIPSMDTIYGRPLWHVEGRELDAEDLHGKQMEVWLGPREPIECTTSAATDFQHYGLGSLDETLGPTEPPKGLLILTLCWAYVLSSRLWEMQRRSPVYTDEVLQPVRAAGFRVQEGHVSLRLGPPASPELIRWLGALLAPKPGWTSSKGGSAAWSAFYTGNVRFDIVVDRLRPRQVSSAPSSSQAVDLLIEFCGLFGLERGNKVAGEETMAPVTAGLLAALALPYYGVWKLNPQFPVPALRRQKHKDAALRDFSHIRQLVGDLRYYMTLSLGTLTVDSIIWGVFWQPDIQCNQVSVWLHSILHVIRPLLLSKDYSLLIKTFAFRRPRVAVWWQGIFLLGNPKILDSMILYLEKADGEWGPGTASRSDTTISTWIGSPLSFFDEGTSTAYLELDDEVPMPELLKHRYYYHTSDHSRDHFTNLLTWRPFGATKKRTVELEIWPSLESSPKRTYQRWDWYIPRKIGGRVVPQRDSQYGFAKDTGRYTPDIADRLEVVPPSKFSPCPNNVSITPSVQATLRMMAFCMMDVTGDHDLELRVLPGAKSHPWLHGWGGFDWW